jgi:membrane protease YdiL (CAAX protease family)
MDELAEEAPTAPVEGQMGDAARFRPPSCARCGFAVPTDARFCPACGAQLPAGIPDRSRAPWTLGDMGRSILFIIVGTLLSFVPLLIAIYLITGTDANEDDPTYLTISIGSSVVLQLLMIGAAVRFGIGKYHLSWGALGFRRPERGGFWMPVPLVIAAYSLMIAYFSAISWLGLEPDSDLPEGTFDNLGPIIAVAVLSLVFAPVVEELYFRGYIFGGLRSPWGVPLAALGSGLLWGSTHLLNPAGIYIVLPITAIGFMFAYAYVYTRSLYASIGAHFLFNLTSFVVGLLSA